MLEAALGVRAGAPPRVLLTRDEQGCRAWAERLEELGGEPILFPCIEISTSGDPALPGQLGEALSRASWLVLSSARGAEAVDRLLDGLLEGWSGPGTATAGRALPPQLRIAAVGPATAVRCRQRFGRVDLVPDVSSGLGLARALRRLEEREGRPLGEVVFATADRGRRELERELGARGATVRRFDVYATLPARPAARRTPLAEQLSTSGIALPDAITLASPSSYEGLRNRVELSSEWPLVTIGPTTSAAVREGGHRVAAEARQPTLEHLFVAVLATLGRPRHDPPGATSPGATSPGATSPGATSPGATALGQQTPRPITFEETPQPATKT